MLRSPQILHETDFLRYDTYTNLCSCDPQEAQYNDYVNIKRSGMTTKHAVSKMKLSKPPPTGIENYHNLEENCKREKVISNQDVLCWNNNKDVIPTL